MSSAKLDIPSTVNPIAVGKRIKARRKELGLTQTQLAAAIGFTDPNTVKYYEKGRLPRVDVLDKLAASLQVTPDWLLGRDKKRPPPLVLDEAALYGGLSDEDKEIIDAVRHALKTLSPKQKDHFFNQVFWLAGNVGDPPKRRRK